jgi:hypothetical protein
MIATNKCISSYIGVVSCWLKRRVIIVTDRIREVLGAVRYSKRTSVLPPTAYRYGGGGGGAFSKSYNLRLLKCKFNGGIVATSRHPHLKTYVP